MNTEVSKSAFAASTVYTKEEKDKIVELRNKVVDLQLREDQLEDTFLVTWLRARYLDLPKAEEMLRASIKWRRENDIDTLLEREEHTLPDEMMNQMPVAYCGISKDGYAAFVVPFGRMDQRALIEKYGVDACLKFNVIFMEKFIKLMKEEGEKKGIKVNQIIEICDVDGYSYRQMATKQCRDFMAKMQANMDNNYPEILRYAMMVNAPKVFAFLFNLLKPLIPKATLDKIDIFGREAEKWKPIVMEKFPYEMIPPYWGGTLEGEDEYCSGHPIWILGPKDVASCMKGLNEEDAKFTKVVVEARERFIQEVAAGKDTIIEWKFKSEGHDVGFQLFFAKEPRAKKIDCVDIIPLSRVDAHSQVQEGSHICENEGIYSLVFDNRYSVLKAKTLLYQITFDDATQVEDAE